MFRTDQIKLCSPLKEMFMIKLMQRKKTITTKTNSLLFIFEWHSYFLIHSKNFLPFCLAFVLTFVFVFLLSLTCFYLYMFFLCLIVHLCLKSWLVMMFLFLSFNVLNTFFLILRYSVVMLQVLYM